VSNTKPWRNRSRATKKSNECVEPKPTKPTESLEIPGRIRWRDWRPPVDKLGESIKSEPTKPTQMDFDGFVGPDPWRVSEFSCSVTVCDPAAWREDFHRWMLGNCAYAGRCFGGIEELYLSFRDWCTAQHEIPCTPREFVGLLSEAGFFFANGLVSGVVLRGDLPIGDGSRKSRKKAKI
jgi:hypothetical protein